MLTKYILSDNGRKFARAAASQTVPCRWLSEDYNSTLLRNLLGDVRYIYLACDLEEVFDDAECERRLRLAFGDELAEQIVCDPLYINDIDELDYHESPFDIDFESFYEPEPEPEPEGNPEPEREPIEYGQEV